MEATSCLERGAGEIRRFQSTSIGAHGAGRDQRDTGEGLQLEHIHLQHFSWGLWAAPFQLPDRSSCFCHPTGHVPSKADTHTSQRLGRVRVPWGSHGNSGTGRTRERAWEGGFGGHMGWAGQGTEASQATPAAATGPASLTTILVWGLGTAGSSGGTGLSGLRTRAELCFGRSQD